MEWNGTISKNFASGKIIYIIRLSLDVTSVFSAGVCGCFGVCDKLLRGLSKAQTSRSQLRLVPSLGSCEKRKERGGSKLAPFKQVPYNRNPKELLQNNANSHPSVSPPWSCKLQKGAFSLSATCVWYLLVGSHQLISTLQASVGYQRHCMIFIQLISHYRLGIAIIQKMQNRNLSRLGFFFQKLASFYTWLLYWEPQCLIPVESRRMG